MAILPGTAALGYRGLFLPGEIREPDTAVRPAQLAGRALAELLEAAFHWRVPRRPGQQPPARDRTIHGGHDIKKCDPIHWPVEPVAASGTLR